MRKLVLSQIAMSGGIVFLFVILIGCGGGGGGSDTAISTSTQAPISFPDTLSDTFVFDAGSVFDEEALGNIEIDDNVEVPPETTLTLNGTTIKGNVYVNRGAQLIANDARVIGNIQAYRSYLVDLRIGTFIDGDVQGKYVRSVLVSSGVLVGGNVQIVQAITTMDVDALWVESAIVDGDVQAEKSGGRLRVNETQVGGNVQFIENLTGPYEIRDNIIDGDLQFFKNQGLGTITGNYVEGNLQSKENNPRPTISGNTVKGDLEDE